MRMEFKNNKNGKRNYSANSIDLFLTRLFFGVKKWQMEEEYCWWDDRKQGNVPYR